MSSSRQRHPKPKIWSVEPKAPSLVSLSVRDQNIPRPPKRSSSLKAAASSLKKGLSSHNLLSTANHNSSHTLHRGKHHSCSSLQVNKTRTKATRSGLRNVDCNDEDGAAVQEDFDCNSSDGTLLDVVEHYWDGLSQLVSPHISHKPSTRLRSQQTSEDTSSETVVHSEAAQSRRPSSGLSYGTVHTASQSRHHSARRMVSRVMTSIQKRKKGTEHTYPLLLTDTNRVEAWVDQARPAVSPMVESQVPSLGTSFNSDRYHEIATRHERNVSTQLTQKDVPTALKPNPPPPSRPRAHSCTSSVPLSIANTTRVQHPLRLRLDTKAELTGTIMAANESIWAIAQIHAELPLSHSVTYKPNPSIAIAFVLDNSRLATRKDVKKACLEIMSLAATLNQGIDHIGVYCTSGTDIADTCLLAIAIPLDLDLLRSKLDKVPQRPRHCFRVQDAFLQAAQALRTLRSRHHNATPDIKEDIVVITSSALGLASCFQGDLESFHVHLVNPSLIPYSSKVHNQMLLLRDIQSSHTQQTAGLKDHDDLQTGSSHAGWLLDSSRCLGEDCDLHKSHSLVDIIMHAKSQAHAGSISNISIKIHGSNDAAIEEVIGELTHATISAGQMISLAVRVRIESLARRHSVSSESSSPSRLSMLDAISELELTLGHHLSELFEIEVSYGHSFFPRNTRLTIRESCWLPRGLHASSLNSSLSARNANATHNTRVQKQLALCIAGSRPPAQALRELNEQFPPSGWLSEGVSNFLDALRRRLKHRAALFADVSFMDYLTALEYTEVFPQRPRRETSYGSVLDAMIDATKLNDEEENDGTPTTIVRREIRDVQPSVATDEGEARRIWQQIRKTSKRGEFAEPLAQETSQEVEEEHTRHEPHIMEIRETALKHGRKISTATLRSLAKDFRRLDSSFIEEDCEDDSCID